MGKRSITVRKAEKLVRAVSATEALRRNLLHAMLEAVSEDDMNKIVAAQVDKAKCGDGKAARLILDMVRGCNADSPSPQMQQAIVVNGNDRDYKEVEFISDFREKVAILIANEGPKKTEDIARLLHTGLRDVSHAVDHEWFEKESDGYHVTAKGMAEVVEPLRNAAE